MAKFLWLSANIPKDIGVDLNVTLMIWISIR